MVIKFENSIGEVYFRVILNNDVRGIFFFLSVFDFLVGFGGFYYFCD